MNNAIYNDQDILEISPRLIEDLKLRAINNPQKRYRLCMHHSNEDLTHEMLIVFYKDTFMPPHRHPKGKSESYHVIEGSMAVYFFNDSGKVVQILNMEEFGGDKPFLYRLSSNLWHMPFPTSNWLVYHETYTGPFQKKYDVEFPSWAPIERDKSSVDKFLLSLNN